MPTGESRAGDDAEPKRGCLHKIGIGFAILLGFGVIGALLAPHHDTSEPHSSSASSNTAHTSGDYAPLNAQQKSAALSHMVTETDKVEDTTFYYDRTSARSLGSNSLYAYVGKHGNDVWLRIAINYGGSDWIFFNHIIIKTESMKLDLYGLDPEHHVGEGYVAEWLDTPVSKKEYALLETIAVSKNVTLRLEGPQFKKDRTITAREKAAIVNVILAYRALGAPSPPN